jgi:hypothetical protein
LGLSVADQVNATPQWGGVEMLSLVVGFFDKLLTGMFVDAAKERIGDYLERRNVARTISRAAEAPGQSLESYFRNEGIGEQRAGLLLDEVQRAIDAAGIDASMLASASLDPEKLTEMILAESPVPQSVRDEGLEWPFEMAVRIAADALCNVGPRFAEWERAAWRRSFDAFDRLLENQEAVLRLVGPGGEGSLDEKFGHTYRSHVLRRLSQIDASTLRVSSSLFLDLAMVFVQPDVLTLVSADQSLRNGATRADTVLSVEDARMELLYGHDEEDERERVFAEQFIADNARCAIVGLPGSGKTTLLQHVLLKSAKGDSARQPPEAPIPLFIRVRDLDPSDLPSADDLLQIAEGRVFAEARPGFLRRQFEAGRVLLLVDGLDEVVVRSREDLMRWIRDLVELYPRSRYVVSSRPAGYQSEVFRTLGFSEARLCDFTEEQIGDYVRRWSKAVHVAEGASPQEAEDASSRYAKNLVESAARNPYVRRIATNPLMLSTLCLVQRYEGGDLPNRRVVLYERCVEGLLFHWDKKRGLPPAILGTVPLGRKIMLLRRLALEMQIEGVAEVQGQQVIDSFGVSLAEIGESLDVALILENIKDRSGLLVERRPGVYGFSHLTFQEYLAALSIQQADYASRDRLFLFSKRSDPQWSEVIALYAGVAPRDSAEQLLEELVGTGDSWAALVAGDCLAAAQNIGLNTQRRVIDAILTVPDDAPGRLIGQLPVQRALDSLEPGIVAEQAAAALSDLNTAHAMRFFFFRRDPASIEPILRTGERILAGVQPPGRWDDGVSLVLLLIGHPDAAIALGQLAELALGRGSLGRRAGIFLGLWEREAWGEPFRRVSRKRRPAVELDRCGTLAVLGDSSARTEQVALCRFLAVASSESVIHQMRPHVPLEVGDIARVLRVTLPPRAIHVALANLAAEADGELADLAVVALESMSQAVAKIEKGDDLAVTLFPAEEGVRASGRKKHGESAESPSVTEGFLSACTPRAARFFRRLIREAAHRDMIISWGSLGFSVRLPLDSPITVMYGFPPDDFRIYTRDWGLSDEERAVFRQSLQDKWPFSLSGKYTNRLSITEETLEQGCQALQFMWNQVDSMMAEAHEGADSS